MYANLIAHVKAIVALRRDGFTYREVNYWLDLESPAGARNIVRKYRRILARRAAK